MYQFPQGELFPPGGEKGGCEFSNFFYQQGEGKFYKSKNLFRSLVCRPVNASRFCRSLVHMI